MRASTSSFDRFVNDRRASDESQAPSGAPALGESAAAEGNDVSDSSTLAERPKRQLSGKGFLGGQGFLALSTVCSPQLVGVSCFKDGSVPSLCIKKDRCLRTHFSEKTSPSDSSKTRCFRFPCITDFINKREESTPPSPSLQTDETRPGGGGFATQVVNKTAKETTPDASVLPQVLEGHGNVGPKHLVSVSAPMTGISGKDQTPSSFESAIGAGLGLPEPNPPRFISEEEEKLKLAALALRCGFEINKKTGLIEVKNEQLFTKSLEFTRNNRRVPPPGWVPSTSQTQPQTHSSVPLPAMSDTGSVDLLRPEAASPASVSDEQASGKNSVAAGPSSSTLSSNFSTRSSRHSTTSVAAREKTPRLADNGSDRNASQSVPVGDDPVTSQTQPQTHTGSPLIAMSATRSADLLPPGADSPASVAHEQTSGQNKAVTASHSVPVGGDCQSNEMGNEPPISHRKIIAESHCKEKVVKVGNILKEALKKNGRKVSSGNGTEKARLKYTGENASTKPSKIASCSLLQSATSKCTVRFGINDGTTVDLDIDESLVSATKEALESESSPFNVYATTKAAKKAFKKTATFVGTMSGAVHGSDKSGNKEKAGIAEAAEKEEKKQQKEEKKQQKAEKKKQEAKNKKQENTKVNSRFFSETKKLRGNKLF